MSNPIGFPLDIGPAKHLNSLSRNYAVYTAANNWENNKIGRTHHQGLCGEWEVKLWLPEIKF